MKKAEVKALREGEWEIEGELVLKEEKVYMLKDEELRLEVIQLHHGIPVAGHGGRWKTTVSNEKLLVARSNEGCWEIYRRI